MEILVLFLIGALFLAWLLTRKKTVPGWMPEELKGAKEHAEIDLQARMPDGTLLVGRSDRVFETKDGFVVLDYKTRKAHRTYPEDILEISAYATLMRRKGRTVKTHGYIVTDDGAQKKTHRVTLLDDEQVESKVRRFVAIASGKEEGCRTSVRAKCKSCGHQQRCFG